MMRLYLYSVVDLFIYCYILLLTVRIISSWFQELQSSQIISVVRVLTDPYLDLFRRIIPPLGALDISPILAFFSLQVISSIVKYIIIAA